MFKRSLFVLSLLVLLPACGNAVSPGVQEEPMPGAAELPPEVQRFDAALSSDSNPAFSGDASMLVVGASTNITATFEGLSAPSGDLAYQGWLSDGRFSDPFPIGEAEVVGDRYQIVFSSGNDLSTYSHFYLTLEELGAAERGATVLEGSF